MSLLSDDLKAEAAFLDRQFEAVRAVMGTEENRFAQALADMHAAPNYGFKIAWRAKTNRHTLTHGDVEINVVPEGGRSHMDSSTTIPGPAKLGVSTGMEYASFPGWIELKISSGRRKDLTHVVEALKRASDEMVDQARAHIRAVDPTYFKRFKELAREAMEEKKQERHEE